MVPGSGSAALCSRNAGELVPQRQDGNREARRRLTVSEGAPATNERHWQSFARSRWARSNVGVGRARVCSTRRHHREMAEDDATQGANGSARAAFPTFSRECSNPTRSRRRTKRAAGAFPTRAKRNGFCVSEFSGRRSVVKIPNARKFS